MNELNPMLLLMAALVGVGAIIAWGLCIYVAVKTCRRLGKRPLAWVLLSILPGPAFLGIGSLAHNFGRSVGVWIVAEALSVALAAYLAGMYVTAFLGHQVLWDLVVFLGLLGLAFLPVAVLGWLGARPQALPPPLGDVLIEGRDLHKSYHLAGRELKVLRGVSLSVRRGEFVAILGASGSGKSTLLHLMGLLDSIDSGSLMLDGADSRTLQSSQRDRIRSRDIGFVFQFYHLLPEMTVLENVMLPAMTEFGPVAWLAQRSAVRKKAEEMLDKVGLSERLTHRPKQLSGGEQQRVAIARALVNSPSLLLADEPTGNLDSKTGLAIISLLKQLNTQTGQTVVMVTHDTALAQMASRIVRLRDGKLERE